MSKVVCITMARMTSSRLPGKTLMKIGSLPLLEYHIERLRRAENIDEIYVATTINKTDDVINEYCKSKQIKCFRGDEEDVLSRYQQCAELANADIIVRVTGDCPLIDPSLVDEVIDCYKNNKGCDYAHLDITKFPRGFDCEVFSKKVLNELNEEVVIPSHREHVTSFIHSHPQRYNIFTHSMESDHSDLRFCVDEKTDLELIEKIINFYEGDIYEKSWFEIVELMRDNPEWALINREVVQKT